MLNTKALFLKLLNSLKGTGWADVPNKVSMQRLSYQVRSGFCTVNGYDNGAYSWPSGTWVTIGTLPNGAKPTQGVYASGATRNGQTYEIVVNANGTIQLQASGTSGFKSFSVTFPVG